MMKKLIAVVVLVAGLFTVSACRTGMQPSGCYIALDSRRSGETRWEWSQRYTAWLERAIDVGGDGGFVYYGGIEPHWSMKQQGVTRWMMDGRQFWEDRTGAYNIYDVRKSDPKSLPSATDCWKLG